jgi:hypothetical protein
VSDVPAGYVRWVDDDFSERYASLLAGAYDLPDRVVLNAFYSPGYSGGGFRCWWRRLHDGNEDLLDDTHLMRMAGRFARRVKAWGAANSVPVIFCQAGVRKHDIAERYLEEHAVTAGVFLVLVAKARATVWHVHRSARGVITGLEKKSQHVYHYSFHIMDPQWGHMTIKMSGHPPFGAQVILNGHEWLAVAAQDEGICFTKEGNCFTEITDPQHLARVADALPRYAAEGRLGQACDRWIYTACLCFGLDLAEQERSGFRYGYSVYQAEYSRNLLFRSGAQMEALFDRAADRARPRMDLRQVRTIFGTVSRGPRKTAPPPPEIVIEKPRHGLTMFRLRYGSLQVKAYTKGDHVLRFEATVHNARALRCRRGLDNLPEILTRLQAMTTRFAVALDCVDTAFLPDGILDELPLPARIGAVRTGGIDLNKPRIRAALAAALALASAPRGFTVADFAAKVAAMTGQDGYTTRQAAYDLRKLRGKQLIDKPGKTRRYTLPPHAARVITALLTLRDHIIAPILASVRRPRSRRPTRLTLIDADYETLRNDMNRLFLDLGIIPIAV